MKLKPSQKMKIFSYTALLSMVINLATPFIVLATPVRAYAEEAAEEVVVEEEVAQEEAAEEPEEVEEEITEVVLEEPSTEVGVVEEIEGEETQEVEEISEEIVDVPQDEGFEELSEDAEIKDSQESDWEIDGDIAETKDDVKLGIKYIFPLDKEVSITFTKLPISDEKLSHLKIERVKVSDLDLPDDFKTDAEYAFDITTNMEDGDFKYDLTLPKPEGVDAEVVYIEKSIDEAKTEVKSDDVKKVEEDKLGQNDKNVKVSDLDHFTIFFVSVSSIYATTTLTTNKPVSVVSGNFLIAGITFNGGSGTTVTPPTGWTLIRRTINSNKVGIETFYKVAGAAEPASYSWGISNGERAAGGIVHYSGVNTSNPIDVYAEATGSDSTVESPSITTTVANTLVVAFFGVDNKSSFSTPTGTTERFDVAHSDSHGPSCAADDFTQVSAGATGTKTANISSNEKWVAQQIALRSTPTPNWSQQWDAPTCNEDPNDFSPDQLDILGDNSHSGAYYAKDSNFLYLRERIEGDPSGPGIFSQNSWVVVVEQTGDDYYDYLLTLNGNDELVQIWENSTQAEVIDWSPIFNDPAESSIWAGSTGMYARIDSADSGYWYVSWAVPLSAGGFTLAPGATLYFATSANANNYNKDHLDCYEEPETGTITIIKDAIPDSSQMFEFTGDLGDFELDDDGDSTNALSNTEVFSELDEDEYIIEEEEADGWELTGIECSGDSEYEVHLEDGEVEINLEAGDDITCTFTNTRLQGQIEFIKTVEGQASPSEWSFVVTDLSGALIGTYHSGDTPTFDTGDYIVTESGPSGYELTNVDGECTESTGNSADLEVTDEGGTCTFTNTRKQGQVEFLKIVDDGSNVSSWTFEVRDVTGALVDTYHSGDTPTLDTGTYTVSESGSTDYYFDSAFGICASTAVDGVATMTVDELGGSCIFSNDVNKGSITIIKDAVPEDIQDFNFIASGNGLPSSFILDDDGNIGNDYSNTVTFSSLFPGFYNITEGLVSGWEQSIVICDSTDGQDTLGVGTASVDLSAGEDITCTFTNTKNGKITAYKFVDKNANGVKDGSDVNYTFGMWMELWVGSDCTGTKITEGQTNSSGITIFNVGLGNYSVKELIGTGWLNSTPVCQNVTVGPGEEKQLNFGNIMLGQINICKYNDINGNGLYSGDPMLSGWTINLVGPGGYSESRVGGCVGFSDLSYGIYTFSEVQQAGWVETIPSGGRTYTYIINYDNRLKNLNITNFQLGSISGQKFNDLDGSGGKDGGEPGMVGWVIELDKDADGSVEQTTTTDVDGNYQFINLSVGTYRVREQGQAGWTQTTSNPGDLLVQSGATFVDVDFGNQLETGTLRVIKNVVDVSETPLDPSNWSINVSQNGNGVSGSPQAGSGTGTVYTLTPGIYQVAELNPDVLDKNFDVSFSGDCARVVTGSPNYWTTGDVTVVAGQVSTCTLTNERRTGIVTVNKEVDTNGDGTFDGDNTVANNHGFFWGFDNGPVNRDMGTSLVYGGVIQLAHAVIHENTVPGYHYVGYYSNTTPGFSCSNPFQTTYPHFPIDIPHDDEDIFVLCNVRDTGTLQVLKNVDLNGDGDYTDQGETGATDWLWQAEGGADHNTGDPAITLPTGNYQITETQKTNFTNMAFECTGGSVDGSLVTITKDANVVCTYSNVLNTYCGDGVLNQDIEQCDGDDGVATGENFCTYNCKLVPIYDGSHSCPNGTEAVYIGTHTVLGTDTDGILVDVTSGKTYLFEATGTFVPTSASGYVSDAGYTLIDGVLANQYGIQGTPPDYGAHALLGNFGNGVGIIDWGNYNPDHVYTKLWTPTVSELQFLIGDRFSNWFGTNWDNQGGMGDNSGELTLNVYECQEPGSIQGRKYYDLNGNGDFDNSEKIDANRLNGWTIYLFDKDMNVVDSMVTGDDSTVAGNVEKGQYRFVNLFAGKYFVCEEPQAGWYQTEPNSGPKYRDSYCHEVDLAVEENRDTVQFGNAQPGSIQGRKYEDLNNNSTRETSESYLDNWLVRLYDSGWNLVSSMYTGDDTTSAGNVAVGQYRFEDLPYGTYYICEVEQGDWSQTDPSSTEGFANQSSAGDEYLRCRRAIIDQPNELVTGKSFGNVQLSDIHGYKWHDINGDGVEDSGEPRLSGWEIFIDTNGNSQWDTGEPKTLTSSDPDPAHFGWYLFTDLIPGTYSVCEVLQPGWEQTSSPQCHSVTLPDTNPMGFAVVLNQIEAPGYNFGNFQKGSVMGCKYNDLNANGTRDREIEPQMGGWTINLYDSNWDLVGQTVTTEIWPNYSFNNLLGKGTHYVCEVMWPGWIQTDPALGSGGVVNMSQNSSNEGAYCRQIDNDYSGNGYYGQRFGNAFVDPQLSVLKENDTGGASMGPGDEVTFTLRVRATGGDVLGVSVEDLMSEGFTYVSGSARINGVAPGVEPNYSSPGSWFVGNMQEGDEVTLTYTAKIGSGVDAGTYKDLAWAFGQDILQRTVFAQGENSDYIKDEFVGTEVEVTTNPEDSEVDVDVEEDEETEEVLGAATTRLPATGAATAIVYLLLALGLIGGLLLIIGGLGKMLRAKGVIALMIVSLGFGLLARTPAYAGVPTPTPVSVRVEDPETPTNSDFNITFVAMNTKNEPMTAKCYVRGPSDAAFSQFGSDIAVTSGGNSYNCVVNGSVLGFSGTYTFKVSAEVGSEGEVFSDDPEEVAVYFDEDNPGRPKYIEKDGKGSCKYEIKFKTADDGQTAYVEVYREFDKEINISSSSRIRTFNMGPNEEKEFDETLSGADCDETPYYAVRAFDTAGNASEPRAEEVVTKVTVTIESEGEETVLGAIGVSGGQVLGAGGEGTGTEGTESTTGGEEGIGAGEVLGEEEGAMEAGRNLLKSPWFWLILISVLLLIRRATKKKEN